MTTRTEKGQEKQAIIVDVTKEETASILSQLIRIKSVNPFFDRNSSEVDVASYIASFMEQKGIEVKTQRVVDERFNVICILPGKDSERSVMLNGHMDTVSADKDLLKGSMDSAGRIHGRGACDMKGALAAMMLAMRKLQECGAEPSADLIFAAVVDEEDLSLGTERLLRDYRPTAAIVGEPTELEIAIAQKGAVRLEVETIGKSAHGAVPERGVDAIVKMAHFILRLQQLKESYQARTHPLLGSPRIHTSSIDGGLEWTTVPDKCTLRVEKRSLPNETKSAESDLQDLVDELSQSDPSFSARVKTVLERKPMEVSEDEFIVQFLRKAHGAMSSTPRITGISYWTDAAIFVRDFNVPACVCGPGNIEQAHSLTEYVEIDQVVKAAKLYALVAQLA